jgi:hypothetical protein
MSLYFGLAAIFVLTSAFSSNASNSVTMPGRQPVEMHTFGNQPNASDPVPPHFSSLRVITVAAVAEKEEKTRVNASCRTQTGVYVANERAALKSYADWIGSPPDNVLTYLNQDSWREFSNSILYAINLFSGTGSATIISVPLTVDGTPLAKVAAGEFNDYFRVAAQSLVKMRPSVDGNIYVRLGWEFNGDWMPWSSAGHEADFISSYRLVVDIFRSVPGGGKFKFVWDASQDTGVDPAASYPGDAYVDVVGMDLYYNKKWDDADPAAAFNDKAFSKFGLQWQQNFAAAHDKPTAISEWGVGSNDAGPFVTAMFQWIADHKMVYQIYWDSDSAFPGKLSTGQYPLAGIAYKAGIKKIKELNDRATNIKRSSLGKDSCR